DSKPAAEACEDRFSAGLYELDDVRIQTDGSHGHDNKEFAQFFQRSSNFCWELKYSCDYGCENEKQYKVRKRFLQAERCSFRGFFFSSSVDGKDQCDRNDRKGSCHFYDRGRFQCVAAVYAVPGCRRCSAGRGVVDRSSSKEAEPFIAQSEHSAQCGENEGGKNVKQEDDRDGLCHFFIGCVDHRR